MGKTRPKLEIKLNAHFPSALPCTTVLKTTKGLQIPLVCHRCTFTSPSNIQSLVNPSTQYIRKSNFLRESILFKQYELQQGVNYPSSHKKCDTTIVNLSQEISFESTEINAASTTNSRINLAYALNLCKSNSYTRLLFYVPKIDKPFTITKIRPTSDRIITVPPKRIIVREKELP